MRIAVFAAGKVGEQVAACFAEAGDPPLALVLDAAADAEQNEAIVRASGISQAGRVLRAGAATDAALLERLATLQPELIVLAWWPYVVKPEVLALPSVGCLNLHPSLLPHNRGKHYNFWNLVEGVPFGVSIHWVVAAVDAGDIAFQAALETSWEDTGETLYHRAQAAIVALFRESLPAIRAGRIPRRRQELEAGSFHRARELEPASRIELDHATTPRALLNLLRARTFPPHPAAWFTDGGETWEVHVRIRRAPQRETDAATSVPARRSR